MSEVLTMGELLVEVMRPRAGMSLYETGTFLGPYPSGAPGIFIDTVARLGHSAAIISGVGADDFGRCIVDRLNADGVDTGFVRAFPHRSTGVAFVTYFEDGSRRFIFHWDGTPAVMARLPAPERIETPTYFHLMGCSLMANDAFREEMFRAVELLAGRGAKVSFDPNVRFELLKDRTVEEIVGPILRHCSILFPGERELQLLSGREEIEQAVASLFERYPLETLVLKRGSRGCSVYSPSQEGGPGKPAQEGRPRKPGAGAGRASGAAHATAGAGEPATEAPLRRLDVPAFRIEEVDPTGAGDCFDAGFLCGLLEGRSPVESARVAAAAGALAAQAFGPMEGKISPQNVADLLLGGRSV